MDKKRIHDLELLSDLSEITETDFLIIDDENETSSKKIPVLMLKDILTEGVESSVKEYVDTSIQAAIFDSWEASV